ncbi:peptidyl-prolyl cis-trans isomerase [Planctomycetota bacterium]
MFHRNALKAGVCVVLLMAISCLTEEMANQQTTTGQNSTGQRTIELTPGALPLRLTTQVVAAEEAQAQSGSKEGSNSGNDEVLVSLGDKKLTMQQAKGFVRGGLDREIAPFVKWWLENELLYEEAEKQGLTKQPKFIFNSEQRRKEVVAKMFLRSLYEPNDAELLAYYKENKETDPYLKEPGYIRFSHIKTKNLKKAKDALQRVTTGEDFNELAKELSIDRDGIRGGKLYLTYYQIETRIGKDFFDALDAAKKGDIIGPIKVKEGFEIARFEGEDEPKLLPFDDRLKSKLINKISKQGQRRSKIVNETRANLMAKAADRIVKSPLLLEMEKAREQAGKPPLRPPVRTPVPVKEP